MQGRFQSLYGAASIGGTLIAPPLAGALLQVGSAVTWATGAGLTLGAAILSALVWPRLRSTDADPHLTRQDQVRATSSARSSASGAH